GTHTIRLRAAGVIADAGTWVVLGSEGIDLTPKRQPDHGLRPAGREPAEQCGEKVLGLRGRDQSQQAQCRRRAQGQLFSRLAVHLRLRNEVALALSRATMSRHSSHDGPRATWSRRDATAQPSGGP